MLGEAVAEAVAGQHKFVCVLDARCLITSSAQDRNECNEVRKGMAMCSRAKAEGQRVRDAAGEVTHQVAGPKLELVFQMPRQKKGLRFAYAGSGVAGHASSQVASAVEGYGTHCVIWVHIASTTRATGAQGVRDHAAA